MWKRRKTGSVQNWKHVSKCHPLVNKWGVPLFFLHQNIVSLGPTQKSVQITTSTERWSGKSSTWFSAGFVDWFNSPQQLKGRLRSTWKHLHLCMGRQWVVWSVCEVSVQFKACWTWWNSTDIFILVFYQRIEHHIHSACVSFFFSLILAQPRDSLSLDKMAGWWNPVK